MSLLSEILLALFTQDTAALDCRSAGKFLSLQSASRDRQLAWQCRLGGQLTWLAPLCAVEASQGVCK